jgi:hypothetical protein
MVGDNNYTKHVEVNNNIMWDAGSIPAASTLQFVLASLVRPDFLLEPVKNVEYFPR